MTAATHPAAPGSPSTGSPCAAAVAPVARRAAALLRNALRRGTGGTEPCDADHTATIASATTRHGDPTVLAVAPGRVNVIGEHTDYNDGFVLPMAIDRYTAVAAAPRADGVLRLVSEIDPADVAEFRLDRLDPAAAAGGWTDYPAGVAWALREAGLLGPGGADLAVASDVPVGSGLSSSAALECAVGLALAGPTAPQRLAALAQRAENAYVGVPCGPLDQLASSLGRAGAVLFIDTRSGDITPYPFDLPAAGLTLLVVNTRVKHDHGESGYRDRRAACDRAAAALGVGSLRDLDAPGVARAEDTLDGPTARRVRHVVSENQRVLRFAELLAYGGDSLAGNRLAAAGELLTASHASLRDDYEVSCPELDLAVAAALDAGAHGARMTGGGFGGSAIALVDLDRLDEVRAAVLHALPQAELFTAVPASGAHLLSG